MIRHVNAAAIREARPVAREAMADQRVVTDYIGTAYYVRNGAERSPLPQAFQVEKPPYGGTPIHFHDEDQFQVFVAGDGRIGPETVIAPAVHFANFHTAYGPIAAGEQGLAWVTLRDIADEGAWFLPESRGHADKKARRRNVSAHLPSQARAGLQTVVEPTDDGLAVWRLGLAGSQHIEAEGLPPFPTGAGGRFHLVLAGALLWQGERLGTRSLIYATAEEKLSLTAGDDGADLLVLQFPRDRRERADIGRSPE